VKSPTLVTLLNIFDIRLIKLPLEQDTFLLHSDQKSAFLAEVEQTLKKVKNDEEIFFTAPYTLHVHTVGYSLICVEHYS
jgi:hypothetical protein